MLIIKRAYDKPEPKDGKRILIDRLWPRGISKAEAGIDEWYKELEELITKMIKRPNHPQTLTSF